MALERSMKAAEKDVATPRPSARARQANATELEPPQFTHPVLRLLAYESTHDTASEIWLRQAVSPALTVQRRVDSAMDFARAAQSSAAMRLVDADGVLRELLDILEPLSVDPRIVEERIRLEASAPPAAPALGQRKRTPPPPRAARWIKSFGASTELAEMLESGEPAWRADQCAAAIRLIRKGLCEVEVFSPESAQAALTDWVLPFWSILLDALGDSLRMQYPGDYQALYGPTAQRLLWERLRCTSPQFTPEDPERDGLGHVVVTEEIPPSHDNVDKAQLASYQRLRAPLPLTELPSADEIHEIAARLSAEFPWALKPIGAIVREALARKLLGGREMGGTALLLVGPPGCGKSRLARRLAQEFGLGFVALPMGGQADHKMLTGTSRGWAGGQPSPIITAMLTLGTANPAVLADEVDKAAQPGENSQGPSPAAVLLGLTERENSRRWRDLFLQAPCDLSKILWLATANSTAHLSRALLDRFRLIELDAPKREHMVSALPYIAADIEQEWNLPAGALPVLPESLVSADVASLRDLRLVARTYAQDWAIEHASASRH
jgi:hypothetical protein